MAGEANRHHGTSVYDLQQEFKSECISVVIVAGLTLVEAVVQAFCSSYLLFEALWA
jgi:hypothetical protein